MTWLNLFQLIIHLDYSDSYVIPSTLLVNDGERRPQSNFLEYDWLGQYPTQNTRGRQYPYISGGFN